MDVSLPPIPGVKLKYQHPPPQVMCFVLRQAQLTGHNMIFSRHKKKCVRHMIAWLVQRRKQVRVRPAFGDQCTFPAKVVTATTFSACLYTSRYGNAHDSNSSVILWTFAALSESPISRNASQQRHELSSRNAKSSFNMLSDEHVFTSERKSIYIKS